MHFISVLGHFLFLFMGGILFFFFFFFTCSDDHIFPPMLCPSQYVLYDWLPGVFGGVFRGAPRLARLG